jgi:hypothetical protein
MRLEVEAHGVNVSVRALTRRRAKALWAMAKDLVEANVIEDDEPEEQSFGFVAGSSLETEIAVED